MMNEQVCELRGVRIAYANGPVAGPPILLLHGVTRRWADWTPVLASVGARWQIWAPDARGHGDSGRVAGAYRVQDYVADTVAFVEHHLKEPALIWGHSLGAMVAASVAGEIPERVRGVILEDPPFDTLGRTIFNTPFLAIFRGMQHAAAAGGTIEELADRIANIELPAPGGGTTRFGNARDGASIRFSARCLSQLDPEVLTPLIQGHWLDNHEHRSLYARIQSPVLLMQSDPATGGALSDEEAAMAVAQIARCTQVRLDGIGHNAHWIDTPRVLANFHAFAESLR